MKRNLNEVKKLQKVAGILKEVKVINLPAGFFVANLGKSGKYSLIYGTNATQRLKIGDIVKYGKQLELLASKYNEQLQIHTTGDQAYVESWKGLALVCYDIHSDLQPEQISELVGGKMIQKF